ncbi:MAG TPA: YIP1 family protein, partial [Myxococcaceae bacterium]|nr:YIP1 family protein [Myxococcaceae bacterium]
MSVFRPARAIVDPVDGISASIDSGSWFLPLLFLVIAVSFSGAAFALRWNATPMVTQQLQMTGELQNTTEQDLMQQVVTAQRIRLVTGVAQGVFAMPLLVLVVAAILKFSGWLFGAPAPFVK